MMGGVFSRTRTQQRVLALSVFQKQINFLVKIILQLIKKINIK